MKVTIKADFDSIYEENVGNVYKTALHYSGNHHVAEEITQTVFMKLYMNIENVNAETVDGWLLTTAKHMALNYGRESKREVLLYEIRYTDGLEEPFAGSCEDKFLEKFREEKYREFTETIFSELYRVNPRWYDAVTITYFLEKPQEEVAEIMGMSLEGLYSMLYRAKKWIRKNYKEQYKRLGDE